MRTAVLVGLVLALSAAYATSQIPDEFVLHQNDPNPFCPLDDSGGTTISYEMSRAAYVVLEVLSPDSLEVERVLVQGYRPAGYHAVMWDGRDDAGIPVEDGLYPNVFTVTDTAAIA